MARSKSTAQFSAQEPMYTFAFISSAASMVCYEYTQHAVYGCGADSFLAGTKHSYDMKTLVIKTVILLNWERS